MTLCASVLSKLNQHQNKCKFIAFNAILIRQINTITLNESFAYQFTSGESSLDKLNVSNSETADQAFQEFSSKEVEEN